MIELLLIGDIHIPDRAVKVPEKLLKIIEEGKPWDVVVFTGDFTGLDVYKWFLSLGKKTYCVKGNMDYLPLPKSQKFVINNIIIGVHHGDGVYPRGNPKGLTRIARELGVNILSTGHTHAPFIKYGLTKEILLLNPGSLTGVWGGGGGSMIPSMMVLDISNNTIYVKHYELLSGDVVKEDVVVIKRKDNVWEIINK
ncbi:MAG: YfcE family phosphodiesterase [Staphylothermus sp.]|nr:YfcE family phosphodiesterase [Staphylothermus sp.]